MEHRDYIHVLVPNKLYEQFNNCKQSQISQKQAQRKFMTELKNKQINKNMTIHLFYSNSNIFHYSKIKENS